MQHQLELASLHLSTPFPSPVQSEPAIKVEAEEVTDDEEAALEEEEALEEDDWALEKAIRKLRASTVAKVLMCKK